MFADCTFTNCVFEDCDLSLLKPKETGFIDCVMSNCKAIWILRYEAHKTFFSIDFQQCKISFSSFFGRNLKQTKFVRCEAEDVDFAECNLSWADFEWANLTSAKFMNTDLTNANFIGATNYIIDIQNNKIKKAKFSMPEAMGLLYSLDITVEL